MKKLKIISMAAFLLASLSVAKAQTTIAGWTFENIAVAAYVPNPAPSTDVSPAVSVTALGMGIFPTPNNGTNDPDVLAGKASDTGNNLITNLTHQWRVRAQGSPAANGWSSLAPVGTQGAQFNVDTTGYTGINVAFDWYATTAGEANLQLQYTTDGTHWNNISSINIPTADGGLVLVDNSGGGDGNSVTGFYLSDNVLNNGSPAGQNWFTNLTATITDPAAANNPQFAIRVVNASTGASCVSTAGTALNNSSGNWRFDNVIISGTASATFLAPTIHTDSYATVDGPFTNTFTDNAAWRGFITSIKVNNVTLPPAAYVKLPGMIIYTPSASTLLQTAGSNSISIFATGYNVDTVIQYIAPGAATHLSITTQPLAPTGNGGTLVTQPVMVILDQYNNGVTNMATVTASAGSGSWGFGAGSGITQIVTNGTATFTNLSITSVSAVPSAFITFTVNGTSLGGFNGVTVNSSVFNIPAPATTGFTPGNLAVYQVDNSANNSTFSIVELSPNIANQSSPVNTFPISATGPSAMRTANSASTGRLADSADGTLVCFAGFLDGSSATSDETTILPRGAGTLDASGTNYILQATYIGISGNQARSATTLDDNTFYMGDKGGVYTNDNYTVVSGTGANVRPLKCFGGKVYTMTQSGSTQPTVLLMNYVNGNSLYPLNGFPVEPLASDFYMVASGQNGSTNDILYYIDGSPTNAIFKFCLSYDPANEDVNGQQGWVPAGQSALLINGGILNSGSIPSGGGDGLCAVTNASGGVDLYYTTGSGSTVGNMLIKVHDSAGYNQGISLSGFQTNYIAPANVILKGVAFAPMSPPAAPMVTTLTASNITASSAVITASVNPNNAATAYWFQYGTNTASYDYSTSTNSLSAGSGQTVVSCLISNLLQGTTYYYQIVATNSVNTSSGVQSNFTTLAVTPPQLGAATLSGGGLHFTFTDAPGASFSVLATNNITAPKATWPVIGTASEIPPGSGNYQFTDPNPATNSTIFYILRQP